MSSNIIPGVCGLENLGNTVSVNSILQCLSKTMVFKDFFVEGTYKKEINLINPLGSSGKLASSFGEFMAEIWSGKNKTFRPELMKKNIGECYGRDVGGIDGCEALAMILDFLHEDLNRILRKPIVGMVNGEGIVDLEELSIRSLDAHKKRNDSIISDYFHGQALSSVECKNSSCVSIHVDPILLISLPLPKNKEKITLQECFLELSKLEELSGPNQFYCRECKSHVDAKKKYDVWKTPEILILHLKRANQGVFDSRFVEFPLELDSSSFVKSEKNRFSKYNLYAVTNYSREGNYGNYNSFAKVGEQWYVFDGPKTSSLSEGNVCTKDSYILFYEAEKE